MEGSYREDGGRDAGGGDGRSVEKSFKGGVAHTFLRTFSSIPLRNTPPTL